MGGWAVITWLPGAAPLHCPSSHFYSAVTIEMGISEKLPKTDLSELMNTK